MSDVPRRRSQGLPRHILASPLRHQRRGSQQGSRLARFSSRTQSRSMLPQLSATAGLLYLQSSHLNKVHIFHISQESHSSTQLAKLSHTHAFSVESNPLATNVVWQEQTSAP